jgi:hypothetical protein
LSLLIPSKKQFMGWNLPTRFAYIVGVVAIATFVIQTSIWGYALYHWMKPAPSHISAADLLVIDQHPTKVAIANVTIDTDGGGDEKFVFLTVTNRSSVTAKNVRLDFYSHVGAKVDAIEPFANGYEASGVDIPAGDSRRYKIASVKAYAKLFNPGHADSTLLRVSTKIQDEEPHEFEDIVCGPQGKGSDPCAFDVTGVSTVVRVRYGSIFGEKHLLLTQFYNTFLVGQRKH